MDIWSSRLWICCDFKNARGKAIGFNEIRTLAETKDNDKITLQPNGLINLIWTKANLKIRGFSIRIQVQIPSFNSKRVGKVLFYCKQIVWKSSFELASVLLFWSHQLRCNEPAESNMFAVAASTPGGAGGTQPLVGHIHLQTLLQVISDFCLLLGSWMHAPLKYFWHWTWCHQIKLIIIKKWTA